MVDINNGDHRRIYEKCESMAVSIGELKTEVHNMNDKLDRHIQWGQDVLRIKSRKLDWIDTKVNRAIGGLSAGALILTVLLATKSLGMW